jgi:hypothetical protein
VSTAGAPLPGAVYQFVVQRAGTRLILDRDAQLTWEEPEWVLSGAGNAVFHVDATAYVLPAADGRDTFGKWDTVITAVTGDDVRFRGIVTDVTPGQNGELDITVDSMATLPHGIPYLGDPYYGAQVDPGDIMRLVWAHVKSYPNSGAQDVEVVGLTGQKVGTFSTQNAADATAAYDQAVKDYNAAVATRKDKQAAETAARAVYSQKVAAVSAANKALTAANKALTAANKKRPVDKPAIAAAQADVTTAKNNVAAAVAARTAQDAVVDAAAAQTDAAAAVVTQKNTAKGKAYDLKVAANKAKKADGGAFTLLWWELPDCGETIDTLTSDWGFDWTEEHRWNADRSGFVTTIRVRYPRAGTKRTDLVFSDSVNTNEPTTPKDNGDDYANSIVGIGAGEGATSIRRERATTDGNRIRRVRTVSEKAVKTNAAMDQRIAPILTASLSTVGFDSITVVDHPNCRIGSWALGDDIRIDVDVRGVPGGLWHRIVSYKLDDPDGTTATLTLKRSSTYTYGG